jgi:hypothetical protein
MKRVSISINLVDTNNLDTLESFQFLSARSNFGERLTKLSSLIEV